MNNKEFEDLKKEILENIGSSRSEEAQTKYEVLKLEEERKRNQYLFWISIMLAVIAVANLIIALIKLFSEK